MATITPLKRAIFESGRTGTEIADEAGIHPTTLSRIANGWHPAEATQTALAAALGMQIEDLWPKDAAA